MKIVNKIEVKLDKFEKCSILCDSDCPLGQLYDFSCLFKALILKKINEMDEQKNNQEPEKEVNSDQS